NDCITNHKTHAAETDRPIGALMTDIKRRGLWDETLLVWGGELGRTPTSEGVGKPGRDHNWLGFSMWLAGAGVRGGQAIGATDELGFEGVADRYHVSDLHATILHLMGFDHRRLSYFYNGLDQRLTGVEERRIIQQAISKRCVTRIAAASVGLIRLRCRFLHRTTTSRGPVSFDRADNLRPPGRSAGT